jgi:SRSO17 transposase
MKLTPTFTPFLAEFAGNFTQPSFKIFILMVTGWLLSHRHRFITELIQSSGSTHNGHHSRYHRFFSHAAWSLDVVFATHARLMVNTFAPQGELRLAVDDTLTRKRGLNLHAAGMHHDPLLSSKALKVFSWGHNWVVIGLLVSCPWAPTKVWCLPLCCRLYRNVQGLTKGKPTNKVKQSKKAKAKAQAKARAKAKAADPSHRTRPQLAVELIKMVAGWFPERQLIVTGDSAYGGGSVLQHLPANVDLISKVAPNGVLYEPAPKPDPKVKRRGRPAKKGKRLPSLAEWALDESQPWQELTFDQFGLHAVLFVKTQQALYYTAGKDRLLQIVLVRDTQGKRPDQRFYCTRLDFDARTILSEYSKRWAIELTFEDSKQLLGFADAANRLPKAVSRTAPMALLQYGLVVAWYDQIGHQWERFPDRPWYRRKREASFADLLSTLRRQSWLDIFSGVLQKGDSTEKEVEELIDFASRAA